MTSEITFWSGAGEVTGANFMLEFGEEGKRTRLLIDCGSVQGTDEAEARNGAAFPFSPESVDALIVTHAHLDHIGRIPKLVRDGFKGPIISSAPTKDLAALMFDDALSIMAERAARGGAAPIYSRDDVDRSLLQWRTHEYGEEFGFGDASIRFEDAGHVLGSASVRLVRRGRVFVFSGDIGDSSEPLLPEASAPEGAHLLLVESVYGDRLHEEVDERRDLLRFELEEVRKSRGTLLIPSFSIERTQVLLSEFDTLFRTGTEPIPVFLDSPLASRVTEVFRRYPEHFEESVRSRALGGDDPFSFPGLRIVADARESRSLHTLPGPKVIIAGSGMSEGGRVPGHEAHVLPDPSSRVLFVGYQSAGTLGRCIADGEREVRIREKLIRVRAHVSALSGYSGHADRDGLLSFVERGSETLEEVFVGMGEPSASMFLAQRIRDFLGIEAVVPTRGERVKIAW